MTLDPIEKSILVPLDPKAAFTLFTEKIETWWPGARHSVSAFAEKEPQSISMTAGVGGEVVEIGHDGTRHLWGTILEWSPGKSVAMTWHPGRTDGTQTEVRVTFVVEGSGTRVTLVHSNWEALGKDAEATREGYTKGWDGVLDDFKNAA